MRRRLYAMCKALKAAASARAETTALQISPNCTIIRDFRSKRAGNRQEKTSRVERKSTRARLGLALGHRHRSGRPACDADEIKLDQQSPIPVSNLTGLTIAENP